MRVAKFILKTSRPRFWLYLFGTYAVGVVAAADNLNDILNPQIVASGIFFLLFANIFLYGVNDLADRDTDALNQKKQEKETTPETIKQKKVVWWAVAVSALCGFVLGILQENAILQVMFALFLFLSFAYSVKPFRFKAKPFVDFTSNLLYILPGVIGYLQVRGELPSVIIILAGSFWAFAMHLFSAVPDIKPDTKAKLKTSAIFFGQKISLLICAVFWLIANTLFFVSIGNIPLSAIGLVYVIIPLTLLNKSQKEIEKAYWYFPFINAAFGALLFFLAFI